MKNPVMAYSPLPVGLAAPRLVPLGRGRVVTLSYDGIFQSFGFWHNPENGEMGADLIFDSSADRLLTAAENRKSPRSYSAVQALREAGREDGPVLDGPPVPEFWVRVVGDCNISANSLLSSKTIAEIMRLVTGPGHVPIPALSKRWGRISSIIRDCSGQSQLDFEPAGEFVGEGNAQTLPDPDMSGDPSPDSQAISAMVNLHPWIKPGAVVEKNAVLGHHVNDSPWKWDDVWGLPNPVFDWLVNRLVNQLVDNSPDPSKGLVPMWLVPFDQRASPEFGGVVQEIFEYGRPDHKPALRASSSDDTFDFK